MKNQEEDLQERLELLPKGYISNKTIGGKIRHYLQWMENGKLKSQYIPDADYEMVKQQVEERKSLERQLKKSKPYKTVNSSLKYETSICFGTSLKALCKHVIGLKKRDCYPKLNAYLSKENTVKICSLYGLRRTGKTTMILQAILNMSKEEFDKTAYIKIKKGQTMAMLDHDLKRLFDQGYCYVFIDEITFLEDFIDTASLLSDIYAMMGMKIVISGTDSLGIWLADNSELYDRTYLIHTTWISYSEHARLLNTKDIDEYIRYGGTLKAGEIDFDDEELLEEEISFRDNESTRRYIDTAICSNIQHSLKCYENGTHFRKLLELYEADELTSAINRIIESMNHRFVLKVLKENFKSNDLRLARKNLLREKNPTLRTDALERIDEESVIQRLMSILNIENQSNQTIILTDEHVREIKEFLKALELIEECPVRYLGAKKEEQDSNVLFTQPGMRYCQAEALIYSLKKDTLFDSLMEGEKEYIVQKILDEVKGRMLEEIVLYETKRKLQAKAEVFKLEFLEGEFDMVVMDKKTYECKIYEIKHSTETDPNQYRHIMNQERCMEAEHSIGPIIGKYVLYRGKNKLLDNGIEYKNVSEYLNEIK